MRRRASTYLEELRQAIEALPEGAVCAGSGIEFVDPDPSDAEHVIRAYCWACPIVGACRELGDALAPHAYPAIYGARFYDAEEPLEGWVA